MPTTAYSIINKPIFWSLLFAGLIPVISLFVPILPPAVQAVATSLLLVLSGLFHKDTVNAALGSNRPV